MHCAKTLLRMSVHNLPIRTSESDVSNDFAGDIQMTRKKERWITIYLSESDFERISAAMAVLNTDPDTDLTLSSFAERCVLEKIGGVGETVFTSMQTVIQEKRTKIHTLEIENQRLKGRNWWQRLFRKGED